MFTTRMVHISRAAQQRIHNNFICSSCFRRITSSTSRASSAHLPPLKPRSVHTSRPHQDRTPTAHPRPLGDFYTDLLAKPLPSASSATSSKPDLPTFVRSGDETKEQRAAKLFGSVRGSGYERRDANVPDASWQTINGVPVPPRPAEPDNCCMSGCVHCVWDDFRDDVEMWAGRLREAQAKSLRAGSHRKEVVEAAGSMDDDGGGSEGLWDSAGPGPGSGLGAEGEDLFQGIPIGIREFMATEKRIRDRKRERKVAR